ncbi:Gp49 family protein [Rhizosphaericola mali]|uniref:Uncharacterized protein n=1 Tax=Rhizosphaericola mali TaxID=2545455 RepID=A0A5P2G052_9BACT|nr:Gp49 family protein [Rhizosphaericola mali]QES88865.1 hypothetical protein E0W69_009425 [Rhizosphaericola mali]
MEQNRRFNLSEFTETEKAINNAVRLIEKKLPPSVKATKAGVLLSSTLVLVQDVLLGDEGTIPNTVTKEQVADNMQDVEVRTIQEFDKPVTHVTVRMKNGFTVRESTTCVDPTNYSEEIGAQICLERIKNQVWFLLGFLLQESLSEVKSF